MTSQYFTILQNFEMSHLINTSLFDSIVPHILHIDENGGIRIRFHRPTSYSLDGDMIRQYFTDDSEVEVNNLYVEIRGYLKDLSLAKYLLAKKSTQ